MRVLRERVTVVWVVLVLATCLSAWVLASDAVGVAVGAAAVVVVAAGKVWLVTQEFMELRGAPRGIRIACAVWIVAVVVVVLAFWFA